MNKKQLLYIIGGIVVALIVLLLVIRLAFGGAYRDGGNGSGGYVNPPARLVQITASSPGSGISYEGWDFRS